MTLTPRQMAAQSRRNIQTAINALHKISDRYGDVDEYNINVAERFCDALQAFANEITEAASEAGG